MSQRCTHTNGLRHDDQTNGYPSARRIATAVSRCRCAGTAGTAALRLAQVSFREGSTAEMSFEQPFDAIVGRYVLLFQADPSDMLRRSRWSLRRPGVAMTMSTRPPRTCASCLPNATPPTRHAVTSFWPLQ